MNRNKRIELLNKLAKPKSKGTPTLKGVHNTKSVGKHLVNVKKHYTEVSSELKSCRSELEKLEEKISSLEEQEAEAKEELMSCHDIMRCMDFANASDVKVNKGDVAYSVDGKKWSTYDPDTHSLSPYKKPSRATLGEEHNADDTTIDDEERADLEGYDVTSEASDNYGMSSL